MDGSRRLTHALIEQPGLEREVRRRAGNLPIWGQFGRCIGPCEIKELPERFEHSDPELQARMGRPYTPDPLPR
jgi:hypothetical protein